MKVLNKKDGFILSELLDFTKDANDNVELYESCVAEDFTKIILRDIREGFQKLNLEPIIDFYNEGHSIVSLSTFNKGVPITLASIREFSIQQKEVLALKIERDVDDGYVYDNFETAILTYKYLVLL